MVLALLSAVPISPLVRVLPFVVSHAAGVANMLKPAMKNIVQVVGICRHLDPKVVLKHAFAFVMTVWSWQLLGMNKKPNAAAPGTQEATEWLRAGRQNLEEGTALSWRILERECSANWKGTCSAAATYMGYLDSGLSAWSDAIASNFDSLAATTESFQAREMVQQFCHDIIQQIDYFLASTYHWYYILNLWLADGLDKWSGRLSEGSHILSFRLDSFAVLSFEYVTHSYDICRSSVNAAYDYINHACNAVAHLIAPNVRSFSINELTSVEDLLAVAVLYSEIIATFLLCLGFLVATAKGLLWIATRSLSLFMCSMGNLRDRIRTQPCTMEPTSSTITMAPIYPTKERIVCIQVQQQTWEQNGSLLSYRRAFNRWDRYNTVVEMRRAQQVELLSVAVSSLGNRIGRYAFNSWMSFFSRMRLNTSLLNIAAAEHGALMRRHLRLAFQSWHNQNMQAHQIWSVLNGTVTAVSNAHAIRDLRRAIHCWETHTGLLRRLRQCLSSVIFRQMVEAWHSWDDYVYTAYQLHAHARMTSATTSQGQLTAALNKWNDELVFVKEQKKRRCRLSNAANHCRLNAALIAWRNSTDESIRLALQLQTKMTSGVIHSRTYFSFWKSEATSNASLEALRQSFEGIIHYRMVDALHVWRGAIHACELLEEVASIHHHQKMALEFREWAAVPESIESTKPQKHIASLAGSIAKEKRKGNLKITYRETSSTPRASSEVSSLSDSAPSPTLAPTNVQAIGHEWSVGPSYIESEKQQRRPNPETPLNPGILNRPTPPSSAATAVDSKVLATANDDLRLLRKWRPSALDRFEGSSSLRSARRYRTIYHGSNNSTKPPSPAMAEPSQRPKPQTKTETASSSRVHTAATGPLPTQQQFPEFINRPKPTPAASQARIGQRKINGLERGWEQSLRRPQVVVWGKDLAGKDQRRLPMR